MTTETKQLGKSSLLSLYGEMEIKITELCRKRKTKLFCKKHEALITTKFNEEKGCLRPKRVYTNKEGKEIVIFCPHLMTLKGEPFYKENESIIYESLEACYEITTKLKTKPEKPEYEVKEDLFTKQAKKINGIKKAFLELQGEN